MKIFLSPQRRDDTLSVVRRGDLLIVNDEPFDFSAVEEGDILPGLQSNQNGLPGM